MYGCSSLTGLGQPFVGDKFGMVGSCPPHGVCPDMPEMAGVLELADLFKTKEGAGSVCARAVLHPEDKQKPPLRQLVKKFSWLQFRQIVGDLYHSEHAHFHVQKQVTVESPMSPGNRG